MRVLFYSSAIQLEPILAMMPWLSREVELHVLLELAPETWHSALFDVPRRDLGRGIMDARPMLSEVLPAALHRCWRDVAGLHFIVHDCRRSLHLKTLRTSQIAARFVRRLKPDLIHLDNYSLRLGLVLWQWRDTPVVLTMHDPEPHSGEGNWRRDLTCKLTFPFVSRYVLFNETWVEPFAKSIGISRDRISTMALGVHGMNAEWPHEPAAEEDQTVLFFGRQSVYKGLEVLYEAAPLVTARVPGVRFIVAGRAERGYTAPRPPVLPNGGTIELFERYLDNVETSRLFERATLLACPNIDASQSGVVLTAYGFGKPVVATLVGGLPEYVEDGVTGLLVPPRDARAFAAAVVRLLEDRPLRERLKENVRRERDRRFSWQMFAREMRSAYEKTLATKR